MQRTSGKRWGWTWCVAVLILAHAALGDEYDYNWAWDETGPWYDGAYWDRGEPPDGPTDKAFVDRGEAQILWNDDVDVMQVIIGNSIGSSGRVLVGLNWGHALNLYSSDAGIYAGYGGTGTLVQTGGEVWFDGYRGRGVVCVGFLSSATGVYEVAGG